MRERRGKERGKVRGFQGEQEENRGWQKKVCGKGRVREEEYEDSDNERRKRMEGIGHDGTL